MTDNQIISHIKKVNDSIIIQTNNEHQIGVAELCRTFASEFGMADWGYFLGVLHDKGKERKDFQYYIRREYGIEAPAYRDKTHAWIGAKIAQLIEPQLSPISVFPILGHHAGLCDYTKMNGLQNKEIPNEINFQVDYSKPSIDFFKDKNLLTLERSKYIHHVVRMLFSCLVDADYLDTEKFLQPDKNYAREKKVDLKDLLTHLENYLLHFNSDTKVNIIRKDIQDCCRNASQKPSGVYSLTVPTGGGKTLSSLLWAILHAIKNNKHRIIVAIPYTSIISQTAAILKSIFGEDAVLEHHSNVDFDNANEETSAAQLATENWDAPIILTTNVQLFESMYSSHPSKCRKLHNIANSVIILDEVQTFPGEHLQSLIDALKAFNELFGASILFTTASQPTLQGIRPGHEKDLIGFDNIEEIIPKEWQLHNKLRRVKIVFDDNSITYEELAERMMQFDRVLCVVNTRKVAAELYKHLPHNDNHFHLSRNMCPVHVDSTLKLIKEKLVSDINQPIRVVTTQLIETGVDIDFPIVMRQEIGLDSILQAAGRCNREGNLQELGTTFVFSINQVSIPNGNMNYANQARKQMMTIIDAFSPEAMTSYFTFFYNNLQSFDKKEDNENIETLLENPHELCFDSADRYFRMIDDNNYSVVINHGESSYLVSQMRHGNVSKEVYRKLSRYSVSIPKYIYDKFSKLGLIEPIEANGKETGLVYISDSKQYNSEVGLSINDLYSDNTLII